MDIQARLQQLLRERGWTEYRLSKECGLAANTIGNIFRRNTMPSLATLETISKGFGISLAQLLSDEDMIEATQGADKLLGRAYPRPEESSISNAKGNEP